ncbi:MAG TPA: GNAT family N-acetyltransferase [Verrucomicrobiota bacterium]|nr:GNAT family N-acetyltransferase [Verrucomicrobiota bacterium]
MGSLPAPWPVAEPRAPDAGGAGKAAGEFTIVPVTADRWPELKKLFGACGGCWCLYWRLAPKDWQAGKSGGNRAALRRLVGRPVASGLLACAGDEPAGWIALAPRSEYPRLARSRFLAPVDDASVWSVTCFFIARAYRGRGLMRTLLEAGADPARRHGARWLEGYPVETGGMRTAGVFLYTGVAGAFRAAGFTEVARRPPMRPIFRRPLR